MDSRDDLRNICVIAHVDHGKTTLVDTLFSQCGSFQKHQAKAERAMDSNDLEKERGITIFSKNASVHWSGVKINIVDTPGHADFGGEVQRILKMVDGALLLVDAVEGPMPQTKYVLQNALQTGLSPLVVINKVDRPEARIDWVVDQVFDLFASLGATDEQLDFSVVYASAKQGIASLDAATKGTDMKPLLDTIVEKVAAPQVDTGAPFQMLVNSIEYNDYLGRLAVGKINRGSVKAGETIARIDRAGDISFVKMQKLFCFEGLGRVEIESASAGDIVIMGGFKDLDIGETLACRELPEALPTIEIDEPTVSMNFSINSSPFAGQSGDKVTGRHIEERLQQELRSNLALRVELTDERDSLKVSGRGELHLSILIETMRREGYEFSVSRPEIIVRELEGRKMEPEEFVVVDVEEAYAGKVIETLGARRGEMKNMESLDDGRSRIEFTIPARGLIGAHGELMTETRGSAQITSAFHRFIPYAGLIENRRNGSLISQDQGDVTAYAIDKLADRGDFFVEPGDRVYMGMVVGESNRPNDMVVNITRGKKLSNVRASGSDDTLKLPPPRKLSLERKIEFLGDDELAEITPAEIRIRKKQLQEEDRKKKKRQALKDA